MSETGKITAWAPPGVEEYSWTLPGYSARGVHQEDARLVEALMCMSRTMRDQNGLYLRWLLPPILAQAIIDAVRSPDPVETAMRIAKLGMPGR